MTKVSTDEQKGSARPNRLEMLLATDFDHITGRMPEAVQMRVVGEHTRKVSPDFTDDHASCRWPEIRKDICQILGHLRGPVDQQRANHLTESSPERNCRSPWQDTHQGPPHPQRRG